MFYIIEGHRYFEIRTRSGHLMTVFKNAGWSFDSAWAAAERRVSD